MTTRLPLRTEHTGNPQADQAQRETHAAVQRINASPAAKGAFIGPFTFTAGQTRQLMHEIQLPTGGTPRGWLCVDVISGDGAFRRTAWDASTISIRSANACTASFWVFA
jgi:hypothetical protein